MTLEYTPSGYTPSEMVEAYKKNIGTYSYTELYFNWGWGGISDGFFNDNSVVVSVNGTKYSFNTERFDLTAHPKK